MGATWGTWEELLLGGAVLRHGTQDWVTVAAELRARALCPYTFTPEVCRAKYDDLQQKHTGCTTWFEEVRKKRMEELKHALEASEDSIGSLETKLETLKAEKAGESRANYSSSQTASPVASQKSEGFELVSKESKDGLSAGSFTLEARPSWSADGHIPSATSVEEAETKPEVVTLIVVKSEENVEGRQGGTTLKKRRGLRKRKDCGVGESGSEASRSSVLDTQTRLDPKEDDVDDLLKIFNSIVEHKCASTFRHRLDSQKRGRYKKMIRRHVDFDSLRSRITSRAIVSVMELFRDLLLLANNALVFYSKSTRERKSGVILRELVTQTMRQHFSSGCSVNLNIYPTKTTTMTVTPIKPESGVVIVQSAKGSPLMKKRTNSEINDDAKAPTKKDGGQAKRVGRRSTVREQSASPAKGRKRVRTK